MDRTIPFYNILMRADTFCPDIVKKRCSQMPDHIILRPYEIGDDAAWARLHTETGDFPSEEEGIAYFRHTYAGDAAYLKERAIFAMDRYSGAVAGACIAWRDPAKAEIRAQAPAATAASLHWLVTAPAYRRLGIGGALCARVLQIYQDAGEYPVYLHTQPWSYPAVLLYASMGFCLCREDTFGDYDNQYADACRILSMHLPSAQMQHLIKTAKT